LQETSFVHSLFCLLTSVSDIFLVSPKFAGGRILVQRHSILVATNSQMLAMLDWQSSLLVSKQCYQDNLFLKWCHINDPRKPLFPSVSKCLPYFIYSLTNTHEHNNCLAFLSNHTNSPLCCTRRRSGMMSTIMSLYNMIN
jgi:hypothetical protein